MKESQLKNSSLSNSSDMTIQSVELNSNKSIKNSPTKLESPSKLKKTLKNDSDMDLVESDIISTLPQQSKKFSPIKNSSKILQRP